jgi:hypothetical protein
METKQTAKETASQPPNDPAPILARTNIFISADDQGINICGLTNIEYLHVKHILQKFIQEPTPTGYTGSILEYQKEIEKTAITILKRADIVY